MPNKLIAEQSPYLLQHAHNPVDWWPWGPAAFAHAREHNLPVLVSIGYAACHWCHVMERESFEDAQTAAFMNEHFVCIKVDREEYPEVDDFYMTAVQTLTGSGGWPLNVFADADKRPFYGGTYFPPVPAHGRPSWQQLLQRMSEVWHANKDEVNLQADQMLAHMRNAAQSARPQDEENISREDILQAVSACLKQADRAHGGFGGAPKFPSFAALQFLLEHLRFTGDKIAAEHVFFSIDKMIAGGIYDQIGGGLSRYATDADWQVPHFEKMLYDNAGFIALLSDAYLMNPKPEYAQTVNQTIDFLLREMKDPVCGFYSALDADSEGVEGKFYTWTYDQWCDALHGPEPLAEAWFGVSSEGNWEHTNILNRAGNKADLCARFKITPEAFDAKIEAVSKRLFLVREKRIRPGTDDKILLSWNALLNEAISKAAAAFQRDDWKALAEKHMNELLSAFDAPSGIKHVWKAGEARIAAGLDDIACLVRALTRLGMLTDNERYLLKAVALTEFALASFSQEESPLLFFSAEGAAEVPLRKAEIYDGVQPSSNALMAEQLHLLGILNARTEWIDRSESMLGCMKKAALRHPISFGYWNVVAQRFAEGVKTIVVVGEDTENERIRLQTNLLPECFYFFEKNENFVTMPFRKPYATETQIFICTKSACFPVLDRLPENLDFAIL